MPLDSSAASDGYKGHFRQTVEKAVSRLRPERLEAIKDTIVLVSDVPGMEIVADGVDPRAGVVLDGLAEPGSPAPIAARVFIYQRNIERGVGGVEQLEDAVVEQLDEEIAVAKGEAVEGDAAPRPSSPPAQKTPPRVR